MRPLRRAIYYDGQHKLHTLCVLRHVIQFIIEFCVTYVTDQLIQEVSPYVDVCECAAGLHSHGDGNQTQIANVVTRDGQSDIETQKNLFYYNLSNCK